MTITTGSMLALAPGTPKAPGTGASTGLSIYPELTDERVFAGLHYAGYDAWLDHVWHAAACTRPVRLRGDIKHIDVATGELLCTIPTIGMPDWSIYKACGNRRASVCPGCAETYRRDAYHIIRAGLIGGKGVSSAVATHPAVFVTLTAPSFGPVHARPVRKHTCADRSRCTCRPEPCRARRDTATCQHGRAAFCFTRHHRNDPKLGQPLCPDCYDYPAHVVWNNQAGELWRRTKQAIERHLGQLARRRGVLPIRVPCSDGKTRLVHPVRVAHGKAAEYQARGAVHFHALLRLDGYDPEIPERLLPPPSVITIADLDDVIRQAVGAISYRTSSHPARPGGWHITWGTEALYAAFVLVLVLGLRRGEVLGLAWDQVDLDDAELYIGEQLQRVRHELVRREVKTETSEAPLPLPDLCVTALKVRQKQQDADHDRAGDGWIDAGLVFTTRHGTPIEPRNFGRSFDRCIIAARVPRITVHGTRKTCASLLAALDVHPRVAMRILRHSKIAVTMEIYTEAPSEATRDALRKLSDWLA